ncbi:sensor domain-containing diguanylate cyclase [Lacticaseibacillus sp. N501-2]|uniref:sensor domain-containing diguanylate cyclase n=1 Tax=Lacticaseibacillus salsurae TaxID=3367729 RepID=UPI0038B27098
MAFGMWLGRTILSVFFVAGYLTYYDSDFYQKLRTAPGTWQQRSLNLLIRVGILLATAVGLQWAALSVQQGGDMYVNLLLFVVSYPLLDESTSMTEYLFNWSVMCFFWFVNHPFEPHLFVLVAAIFAIGSVVLRQYQVMVHYHFAWYMFFAIATGTLFWITYVGMPLRGLLGYPTIFALMSVYAFTYIRRMRSVVAERDSLAAELNHDALTQAYSLMRLNSVGAEIFEDSKQTNQQLAVAVMDIDHFKSFNDDYGHAAGDAVLIGLTKILQAELTAAPMSSGLYRTGGEELTILMPGFDMESAVALVRNCWNAVRTIPVAYQDNHFRCSVSVGVAFLEEKDQSLKTLLKRADNSMYLSKQHGRDRITVDGQADLLNNSHSAMINYTYYTQPVTRLADNHITTNEMRLECYTNGHWGRADHYTVTVDTMMALIRTVLHQLEVPSLAMNFEVAELADPQIKQGLLTYLQANGQVQLIVELDHMTDVEAFAKYAPIYRQAGVRFVIDHAQTPRRFAEFAPVVQYFDSVKVALPPKRDAAAEAKLLENLRYWQHVCQVHHLDLSLDAIESDADMRLVDQFGAVYGQGNFFSRPVLPRIL